MSVQRPSAYLSPKTYIQTFKSSPFLRHNFVFFSGSMVTAFLNYLFYPILSRLLQPADYGEVQTLTSLFTQAAIFLMILGNVTIYVTVNVSDKQERNRILLSLERAALIAGLLLLLVALIFVEQLKRFLHFREVWPFVALIVALALSIPQAFRVSYLRGRWHYTQVSLVGIIGSAAKLILGTALVLVGWRSFGAITGLALAQVVTLGVCLFWAHQAGFHGFGMRRTGHLPLRSLKPQLLYAGSVLLVSGSITIMQTLDVVAVKHYFTALQAGLYAGVTTIAGIVFFLMSPVVSVLITLVSLKQPPAKNRLQLQGSLVLMAVLGGAALLVMALFPETVIRALVGSKYLAYAPYLSRIGLFMMLLSLANAFTMYHIALSRYQYSFGAPAALAVTLGLLSVRHGSILAVINDLLLGSASVLFFTVMQSFIVHTRGISKHSTTGG